MNNASSTAGAILACSRPLIAGSGFNGFSYADIAAEVGIRKPSIHHHFPTKADLATLIARYLEEAQTRIGDLECAIAAPVDQLRAYIGHWKRCIGDATAPFYLCALLSRELPVWPERVALP